MASPELPLPLRHLRPGHLKFFAGLLACRHQSNGDPIPWPASSKALTMVRKVYVAAR